MARVGLTINDEDWAAFAVGGWNDNMRDRMAEAVGDWEEDRWDRRTISGEKDIKNTWPIPAPQIIWRDLRQEAARMRAPALLYDQEQGAKVLFTVWIMLATWIDREGGAGGLPASWTSVQTFGYGNLTQWMRCGMRQTRPWDYTNEGPPTSDQCKPQLGHQLGAYSTEEHLLDVPKPLQIVG